MAVPYRAVLAGLGNIAWKFGSDARGAALSHAAALRADERTRLVGGASPAGDDRESFSTAFDLPAYENFSEMLEAVCPDLVSICSPTQHHAAQVRLCLEYEVPMVWLEKPPAENAAQLCELLSVRESCSGRTKILVNYQRRYIASYNAVRRMLLEQELGPCVSIELRYSRGLAVNGSHMLDMLFFLMGNESYELDWIARGGDAANPSFGLLFESGIQAFVTGNDLPYHDIDLTVTCEGGRFGVRHGGMTPWLEPSVEHELFPGFYRLQSQDPESMIGRPGFGRSFEDALDDLIMAHENEREPSSTLSSAFRTQDLVERVLRRVK